MNLSRAGCVALLISNPQLLLNSGAEYVRKEVPLHVLPTRNLLKLDTTLTSYCDMQHVLFEEEKFAYNQAMQQNIW
jgi:BRCA1/BRCA2-containing complex subunit 3